MTNEQLLISAFAKGHITRQQMEDGLMKAQTGGSKALAPKVTLPNHQSPLEALGIVPSVTGPGGAAPKPTMMTPSGHPLTSLLPQNSAMGTAGALAAGGATIATGGGVLPAILAGAGGALSKTPGDVAQAGLLGSLSNYLPGPGSSRIMQALKGAVAGGAMSAGGQEVKSAVDNHELVNPLNGQTALGALLGGVAGAAGKPLGELTPEQKAAKEYESAAADYAARKASHLTQDRAVRRMEVDSPVKVAAKADAAKVAADAEKASKLAADNLKKEAARVATYDKSGYAARQAQLSSDIHANSVAASKAQEALDDATRNLKLHESDMTAKEVAAKKLAISEDLDKVTELRNKNSLIQAGRRPDGTVMGEEEMAAAPLNKAKNTIEARMVSRQAHDTNSGVIPMEYEHPPERLATHANLLEAEQKAMEDLTTQHEAGQSLRQQKLDHTAQFKGKGTGQVAQEHYDAVDAALEDADKARAAARAAREAHLDHMDTVAQAKKQLIDLEPGEAPEPPEAASASGAVSKLGGLLSTVGMKKSGAAAKLIGALSAPTQTKAPEAPAKGAMLLQELLAGANGGQVANGNGGVDMLRQLLSQGQAQSPEAP